MVCGVGLGWRWWRGGKERENRLSVWLNSKIAFSPSGSASTDVSFRPHGRATLKSAPVPTQFSPFVRWRRETQPTVYCSSTPHPSLSNPLLMLAGGTIGEGLAQNWGGVAGQQNGLWILCLWILRVGGPALSPSLCLSLTHTHRNTLSLSSRLPISSSTRPEPVPVPWLCDVVIGGPERKPGGGLFRINRLAVPRRRESALDSPGWARGQEGPALAHVETASDWVAVNTNPAPDYHWHGDIKSNKWTYTTEHTRLQQVHPHQTSNTDRHTYIYTWRLKSHPYIVYELILIPEMPEHSNSAESKLLKGFDLKPKDKIWGAITWKFGRFFF